MMKTEFKREKDSLVAREASAGRVAFTLRDRSGTNAIAGEAATCISPVVQNACSRPCSEIDQTRLSRLKPHSRVSFSY
jgi:hypothetical protein